MEHVEAGSYARGGGSSSLQPLNLTGPVELEHADARSLKQGGSGRSSNSSNSSSSSSSKQALSLAGPVRLEGPEHAGGGSQGNSSAAGSVVEHVSGQQGSRCAAPAANM